MKRAKEILVIVICIALIIGGYFYLVHSSNKRGIENTKDLTEIEKVLTKDLSKNYPKTPREVITYYNRILGCLYNEECTNEQFEKLAEQMRLLMDEELIEQNPDEDFINNLKQDIAAYAQAEKKIATTTVSDSADVEFKKIKGRECAYVSSSYFVKEGTGGFSLSTQRYVLRKDSEDQWKILAFTLVKGDDTDE